MFVDQQGRINFEDVFARYNQLLFYCATATKRFNAKRTEILNIIARLQENANSLLEGGEERKIPKKTGKKKVVTKEVVTKEVADDDEDDEELKKPKKTSSAKKGATKSKTKVIVKESGDNGSAMELDCLRSDVELDCSGSDAESNAESKTSHQSKSSSTKKLTKASKATTVKKGKVSKKVEDVGDDVPKKKRGGKKK